MPSVPATTPEAGRQWPRSFDIFCRVIDNYGDIGVCWRLAQQLAATGHGRFQVRLWVDDLQRCQSLVPEVDIKLSRQTVRGVELLHWTDSPPDCLPHDVIIESFACDPPASFLARLSSDHAWINLEYLSAEAWVDGCHGLASPQQHSVMLKKRFFFPGFTPATGGLLREPGLLKHRDAWRAQPELRWQFLQDLGLAADAIALLQQGAQQVFLFCYPHAPAGQLLDMLSASHEHTIVLLPQGVIIDLPPELPGNVEVHRIPFVPQDRFDFLLWSSDLNCIRGEDSLVRGLWAGRPLLWHIYAQEDDVHLQKLDAWLARSPYPSQAQALLRAWNQSADHALLSTSDLSLPFLSAEDWQAWHASADQWADTLASMPDLVSSLLHMLHRHTDL